MKKVLLTVVILVAMGGVDAQVLARAVSVPEVAAMTRLTADKTAPTDSVARVRKNNWTAVAKSAILPGWGQMGKGLRAEGIVTLGSEIVLAGGAIGAYLIGSPLAAELKGGISDVQHYNAVQGRYRTLTTVNHVLWTAAAAVYLFNIYRAYASQPERSSTLELGLATTPTEVVPTIGLAIRF